MPSISLSLIGFFVVSLSLYSSNAACDTITLRADVWCPYNCDPGSARPGFMVEIAKSALEPAGHKVDYQVLNWTRAISETRKGKFNGSIAAALSDAPDFVFPTSPSGSQRMCFFTRKDKAWTFAGVKTLENILFGAIKDFAYCPVRAGVTQTDEKFKS